jgi:hypothetical protein
MVVQCETWVWAWVSLNLVLWKLLNTLKGEKRTFGILDPTKFWCTYDDIMHCGFKSTIRLVLVPFQFPRLEEHSKVRRKFTFSLSKSLLRLVYANIVYCKSHYFHKLFNLPIWVKFFLLPFWMCQLKEFNSYIFVMETTMWKHVKMLRGTS